MTAQQPLFYRRIVPLRKEQHRNLYFEPITGFAFARNTNSIFIAASEFSRVAAEYPIVFGKDAQDTIFPVALLGLKRNENLFVTDKGDWEADYVPAYVRRYPFILALPRKGSDQLAVCIDESFAGFNTVKEGEPLFREDGREGQVLQRAVEFLKGFQAQVKLTESFCKAIAKLDLLAPMQANVELPSGEKYAVGGFQCVDRDKLKALTGGKLVDLVKSDRMELIYLHLASLNNVRKLTARLKSAGKSAARTGNEGQ
jgi:hypothetical protein